MLELAVLSLGALYAGWFVLLYRFHRALQRVDPALSDEIGKPSLFWTAFNGHRRLVELMRRRDLGQGRYAPLKNQALVLRVWAVALIACLGWVLWAFARAPAY